MFCTNCGNQIDSTMAFCTKCGAPIGGGQPAPVVKGEIKNHIVGAIVLLVFCIVLSLGIPIPFVLILPLGIITMVKSCKVNPKLAQGDVAGAQEASKKAKFWVKLTSAILGALIILSILMPALGPAFKHARQAAENARQQRLEQNGNY